MKEMFFKTESMAVAFKHPVIVFAAVVWAVSKSKTPNLEQVS